MKRKISVLLIVVCIIVLNSGMVLANSAQTSWDGRDRAGLIVTDDNCPVVVEKELLTFDLQKFPANHYTTKEAFLSYKGKVTAEYTFFNPEDYNVTATLAFPFGNEPDYAFSYDRETGITERNTDTQKYDITVDGEKIESSLRHTFSYRYSDFDLNDELPRLVDGYMTDWFYNPQLMVTKFVYDISGVDTDNYNTADLAFIWNADRGTRRIFLEDHTGLNTSENHNEVILSSWAEKGKDKIVYIIGRLPEEPVEWKCYKNGADEEEIEGAVRLKETVEMTFRDFALTYWDEETGVSEVDWYNAVVTQFNLRDDGRGILSIDTSLDVAENLMRWYKYDITLAPGETIVNTVTAPIYPSIDGGGKVPVYEYEYLLSPASTWADFGKLDIVINTPYYMLDSSLKGFEKTEGGYALSADRLPDGELAFTLCSEEKPDRISIYVILLPVMAAAGLLCIYRRKRCRKNN